MNNSKHEHRTIDPDRTSVTTVTVITREVRLSPLHPETAIGAGAGSWLRDSSGTSRVVTEVIAVTMADGLTRTAEYRKIAGGRYASWALSPRSSKGSGEHWNHSSYPYELGMVIEKVDDSRSDAPRHLRPSLLEKIEVDKTWTNQRVTQKTTTPLISVSL